MLGSWENRGGVEVDRWGRNGGGFCETREMWSWMQWRFQGFRSGVIVCLALQWNEVWNEASEEVLQCAESIYDFRNHSLGWNTKNIWIHAAILILSQSNEVWNEASEDLLQRVESMYDLRNHSLGWNTEESLNSWCDFDNLSVKWGMTWGIWGNFTTRWKHLWP